MNWADIIGPLITGGCAIIGVVITNLQAFKSMQSQLNIALAVITEQIKNIQSDIDEMKAELKKLNEVFVKIPMLEEKIKNLDRRLSALENGR